MFKNSTGIIQKIRQSRTFKGVSVLVLFSLLFEIAQPTVSLALTEGPSQPEVQSFEPVGTTQMVDLFSGDFNYNIPLFNLPGPNGGYPFNLAYHAGVSADDEASWVGLGWNINAGSLVRNMRGLPDEFQSTTDSDGNWNGGDYIETKTDMKPSWSLGLNYGAGTELVGANLSQTGVSASLYFNNYRGLGVSVEPSVYSKNGHYSLGLSLDGENGLGVSANVSLQHGWDGATAQHTLGVTFDGNLSTSYSLSVIRSKTGAIGPKDSYGIVRYGSSSSFARSNFNPSIGSSVNKYNLSFSLSTGDVVGPVYQPTRFGAFFQTENYDNTDKKGRKRPVIGYSQEQQMTNSGYYTKDFVRMNDGQITKQTPVLAQSYYAYDSYSSTGQGLSGYFRGRRNDVGRVHDPKKRNTSWGASIAVEIKKVTTTTVNLEAFTLATIPPITIPGGLTTTTVTDNHVGLGGSGSFGWDKQGPWDSDATNPDDDLNQLDFDFTNPATSGIRENHYYQAHGEQTILDANEYDYINGLDMALVKFATKDSDDLAGGKRRIRATDNPQLHAARTVADGKRVVRNTLIHNLTNAEVGKLGEYQIKYYAFSGSLDLTQAPTTALDRTDRGGDITKHYAGFKVLNEQGSYYVYGLPAYNKKEVENVYSVNNTDVDLNTTEFKRIDVNSSNGEVDYEQDGTHKFINKTTKSPYAHSYMLTSIQGADYVDVLNDGPTNDDLGYWVKFDYVRYTDNYKWRAPYSQSQFHSGASYTPKDNKGSYQYGEKEVWYLGRAETKTHIAIFKMSERTDSRAAESEYDNDHTSMSDNPSALKLDLIEIYEKSSFGQAGAKPVQVVHFQYKASGKLCPGAPNNTVSGGGKLTLEKIWFTSYGSQRKRNQYTFDYGTVNYDAALTDADTTFFNANLVNPSYKTNYTDPWGTYKASEVTDYRHRVQFPYTNQFNQDWDQTWAALYTDDKESDHTKKVTQTAQDLMASAWCLRKITLPSGGTINVDYESDDYGYVQHKTANQMFRITRANGRTGLPYNQLYQVGADDGYAFNTHPESRRIYFKLEHPIATTTGNIPAAVYDAYVRPIIQDESGVRNAYVKTKIKLVNDGFSTVEDYVSGYLPIEEYRSDLFGVSETVETVDLAGDGTTTGVACYTYGFITLQLAERKDGTAFEHYHPISLMAWNYMQTQAQELMNNPNSFDSEDEGNLTFIDILGKIVDIMNFVPAAATSFGAVRLYCQHKGFAATMDLNNSCVRLASPDKKKLGGGHRVKQISITDSWSTETSAAEADRTYGQRFDYTITENGKAISSGVAQYEPQAGGDENALKYPIYFYGKTNVFTSNNLFAEAPMNEDLFPGAMVGYRRVSVTSLRTDQQIRNVASGGAGSGRTGGVTVSEFYTAKEFPTMVEQSLLAEENSTKDVFNLTIPIPLIGTIKRNYYHGSQAFKIELNDMHGKPKSVKSYELTNGYVVNTSPITTSEYEYQANSISYQGEQVFQLDNYVNVIPNDGTHTYNSLQKRLMGVEAELFTDQRESKTFYNTIGLDFNVDMPETPVFLPTFWPSYSNFKTLFRTYVTNKVVHKTGILKKTKARDLQTTNESEIIAYDEKSGIPLLTKVKNEFGDDFYNYNIPSYYAYEGMGHAYRNINYLFCTTLFPGDSKNMFLEFDATQENLDYLVRGDELLVYNAENTADNYKKAYFLGWRYTSSGVRGMLNVPDQITNLDEEDVCLKVIRSGRRNQFGVPLANYLSKGKIADQFETDHTWYTGGGTTIVSKQILNNVLSATASLYRDDWTVSVPSANNANSLYTENPYLSGNSGIWRAYKSYTYVGDRSTTADMGDNSAAANPKLYNDGVMIHVPMFTWELGNVENYGSNWEWVNEVTRYSPDAYELENKNRLGIFSSALYGYDNSLSIGVAGNAGYNEVGVADFETLTTSSDAVTVLSQTNMNFQNHPALTNAYLTEQYNVVSATTSAGSNVITLSTDIPYSYYSALSNVQQDRIGVSLLSRKSSNGFAANIGYYLNAAIQTAVDPGDGTTQLTVKPYLWFTATPTARLLPDNGTYYGKISLPIQRPSIQVTNSIAYSTAKAHTGKKSLLISAQSVFDQPKLKLKSGKQYVLSTWISGVTSTNVPTYKHATNPLVEIGTMNSSTFTAVTPDKITYSKIVEGWQKIDIEFTVASGDGNKVFAFRFNTANMPSTTGTGMHVDDVRISPKTGGLATYVYDTIHFWLSASLNVDNYATLFYYDEEGNLHLKKQETEEGVFTITESRGYVPGN